MLNIKNRNGGSSQKTSRRSALNYYRSAKPGNNSPFQRRAQSKKRSPISRAVDWLVIVGVMAVAIYALVLQSNPIINVSSTLYHQPDVYREAAQASLQSLKNRNKLTFDSQAVAESLKTKFPEIINASIDVPLIGQTPTLRIEVAKPALMLKLAADNTPEETLIIDSKGTVIGPSSKFQAVKDLPLVYDESGLAHDVGKSILSQTEVSFILTLLAQAKNTNVPIESLTLPRSAQQLNLRSSDRNYYVKFYLGGDALTQSGQYLAAREHFDKTKKQPKQYLDVRVNGKVYFK